MHRRALLAGLVCASAGWVGTTVEAVPQALILPLPQVKSFRHMWEVGSDGSEKSLGWSYSPLPRMVQIRDLVDHVMRPFEGRIAWLRLTLLDKDRQAIRHTLLTEAFRRPSEALGWFGADQTLKAAGLWTGDLSGLDLIRFIRIEP